MPPPPAFSLSSAPEPSPPFPAELLPGTCAPLHVAKALRWVLKHPQQLQLLVRPRIPPVKRPPPPRISFDRSFSPEFSLFFLGSKKPSTQPTMSSLVRSTPHSAHKDSQWPPRQLSPVGILGGTGLVGRMLARSLCDHPFLCCGPIVGSRYVLFFFLFGLFLFRTGEFSPSLSLSFIFKKK